MGQKKINLAEGRLTTPSQAQQESAGNATKKSTNYGVGRLGITSETEEESSQQVQQVESPPEQETIAPQTDTARRIGIPAVPEETTTQTEPAEADTEQQSHVSDESSEHETTTARSRRKVVLLLAGTLGGMLVVGLVLLGWYGFSGGSAAPQTASAGEESSQNQPGLAATPAGRTNTTEVTDSSTEPKPPSPAGGPAQTSGRMAASPAVTLSKLAFHEAMKSLARLRQWRPKAGPEMPPTVPPKAAPAPKPDDPHPPATVAPKRRNTPLPIAPAAFRREVKLTAIMRGPNGPAAIINNRFVTVGKTVKNAKIMRIGEFSVEIELDGKRYLIGISSPSTQTP